MRSPLVRCLVVLLAFALANGNAHAALRLAAAHPEPCPKEHANHHGRTPQHQHQLHKGLACCCDCLGCASTACLSPELNIISAEFPTRVHYDGLVVSLAGRALLPEPDPPRSSTLS